MARNEEKSHGMMNKWVTMKENIAKGGDQGRRPFLASDCDNLQAAEKWRRDILRETTKLMGDIQNAGAGEHKIRDLNDQINKLIRERGHWEKRIVELGGPNYAAGKAKSYDADGRELRGGGGYKYFGAARDLPGVRELFQKSEAEAPRRTRGDMYQGITPDYYGYRDDEDGLLEPKEAEREEYLIAEAKDSWREQRAKQGLSLEYMGEKAEAMGDVTEAVDALVGSKESGVSVGGALDNAEVKSHVPLPRQEDISAAILAKKKAALLAKIMGGDSGGGE